MRRLMLLIAGASIWLFLFALPVFADNGPHIAGNFGATPAACATCHRAHSAVAANLLVNAQPALCYQCHGTGATGATTIVQDGSIGGAGTQALRGGGFSFALISTSAYSGSPFGGWTVPVIAATATTSHHSLTGAVTMWGNGPILGTANLGTQTTLSCGSCHDPHGDHTFRILRPGPDDSGVADYTFETGYTNGGRVYVNDVATTVAKDYTTTNYGVIDPNNQSAENAVLTTAQQPTVPFNGDGWNGGPQDNSVIAYNTGTKNWYGDWTVVSSQWCATCHTRYLAPTGSGTTSSGDAVFNYRHAIYGLIDPNAPGNVAGTIGTVATWLDTNALSGTSLVTVGTIDHSTLSHGPKCLTCHVAHGSNAFMATSITSQTSPGIGLVGTPSLDSTLLRLDNRGVCQACHKK